MKKSPLISVLGHTAAKSPLTAAGILLSITGSVAFALIPPLMLGRIVDALAAGDGIVISSAVLYFLSLALSGLSDAAREMLLTRFGQKITHGVRSAMCAKLSRLPAAYFASNDPGAVSSRFVNDVDTVETLFASGAVGMLTDACKVIGVLAVICVKSPGLGLLMLAVTPVLFAFTRRVQKRTLEAQLKNRVAVGRVTAHVPETVRCIRMIHVFKKEKYMEDRYDERIQESYDAVDKANIYDSVYSPVVNVISAITVAVMMALAAQGGAAREFFGMSVGTAVAIIAYVGKVFEPLESIGMEIQSVQSAIAGVRRISDLLSAPERVMPDPSLTAERLFSSSSPAVELSSVRFAYGDDAPVLDGLSFRVDTGESVTLAGRTGAGKSTVFKLLLGLYTPQGGGVKIFGADAFLLPDNDFRRLFGYVEQTFRPVPGSVLDQIVAFDGSVSRAAAEDAARLSGIYDSISSLPGGFDCPYSDSLFSQGQKQLLAISRAAAANPAILLLDEIAANLDADTESKVIEALKKASADRTVLSISHRLYEHTGGRIINI